MASTIFYLSAILLCFGIIKCASGALPVTCYEAMQTTRQSGIYSILIPAFSNKSFFVSCDNDYYYGGWTVIQRRIDGSMNFYKNWTDYKNGFGDLRGEFFIGLDKLNAMTQMGQKHELLIVMTSNRGVTKVAKYDSFSVANEKEKYKIQELGEMSGNLYDAMDIHFGQAFTTADRDNDLNTTGNCAVINNSAWWYKNCYESDLNGPYGVINGINWHYFEYDTSASTLTFTQMMIRPVALFRERLD